MKWSNLKLNKCPKCDKSLVDRLDRGFFRCSCGFGISEKRYREIISSQVNEGIEKHYRPLDENPE